MRIAAVVARFQGSQPGFVLAGRSLREVEVREDNAGLEAGAAWIVATVASLAGVILCEFILRGKSRNPSEG